MLDARMCTRTTSSFSATAAFMFVGIVNRIEFVFPEGNIISALVN